MRTRHERVLFMFLMLVLVCFCGTTFAIAPLVVGALIAGGAQLIGGGIQAWANWKGMQAQAAENQRAEAIGTAERKEDIARSEKWATIQNRQNQAQLKLSNSLQARGLMLDMFSGNTQMANNMINIWRSRRA